MILIRSFVALSLILGLSFLQAAAYKGQKIYMKTCKQCHGDGQRFTASKKQNEWAVVFKGNGAEFAAVHLESQDGEKVKTYFSGQRYQSDYKHLRDFFVEFAADSGNVPACN